MEVEKGTIHVAICSQNNIQIYNKHDIQRIYTIATHLINYDHGILSLEPRAATSEGSDIIC